MTPFLKALQAWRGRQFTQSIIENNGYLVAKTYQNAMKSYCADNRLRSDIDIYWNDVAE